MEQPADPGINVVKDDLSETVQGTFQRFLNEWKDEHGKHEYMEQAKDLWLGGRNTIFVNFLHMLTYDENLAHIISTEFYRLYPCLCVGARNFATKQCEKLPPLKDIYVSFDHVQVSQKVRELTAEKIGKLVRISGQVVRTHPVHPELVRGTFTCLECNTLMRGIEQQFKYTQPTTCMNPQCHNRSRFKLEVQKSVFADYQKVRIQETQAELPRGSIPRSLEVIMRAEIVEHAQPGDRCDFTGTLIVVPDVSQISMPGGTKEAVPASRSRPGQGYSDGLSGLKSLGVRELTYKLAFLACNCEPTNPKFGGKDIDVDGPPTVAKMKEKLDPEDLQRVYQMSNDKDLRRNLTDSLFPTIYGCEEIKNGVLLMLFGGVPKTTGEGITLRGDINVCIVGDPSTAKSQVLKQVEEFSSRCVYTSGKASSAAGLTAAVVRDEESSEFVIEAGALMLADNGVCCIDEFDKMDPKDQVAIHEAMEQQTISITKAGVKATLNARTSILAAANPIGGRYERSKSLRQNINLTAPILSRFDLFFILVDQCNDTTDYAIAKKIVDLHRLNEESVNRAYSVEDIQKYILFARMFKPKLTPEAGDKLVELYKRLRQRDAAGAAYSSWRITVRQLESLIRLSEATARMYCQDNITTAHVEAAYNLLNRSIIRVEQPDVHLDGDEHADDLVQDMDATPSDQQNGADAAGSSTEAQEQTAGSSKPAEHAEMKVTYDQYMQIVNMLVFHMTQEEHRKEARGEDPGMKMSELANWYLQEIEGEIETEAQLEHQANLVRRVINRLISHENVLLSFGSQSSTQSSEKSTVHGSGDSEEPQKTEDDPILIVHPNFVPDE